MTELVSYIASLENMSIPELKKIWEQYFKVAPEQNTKSFLVRRIAYRVQELKYGGLSPNIIKLLKQEVKQININPVNMRLMCLQSFMGNPHGWLIPKMVKTPM